MSDTPSRSTNSLRQPSVLAWLRLARVFRKVDDASADHLRAWNLSVALFDIVAQLGAAEGLTQQALAGRLLVTKGNISQLAARGERAGLIRRCPEGPTKRLFLTEAGRQLHDRVVPAQQARIAALLAVLSPQEQHHLLALLRTLDHALTDQGVRGK
jgi:DNA-binding MarR family transcriptional regulator